MEEKNIKTKKKKVKKKKYYKENCIAKIYFPHYCPEINEKAEKFLMIHSEIQQKYTTCVGLDYQKTFEMLL